MDVEVVSGRTAIENRKSMTARFITNMLGVALSDFSFHTATNTNALPQAPNTIKEHVTKISIALWNELRVGSENCDIVE